MSSATTPTAHSGPVGHKLTSIVDNKKLGLARRSTPDSEALLSSDDDHDLNPAMSVSMHSLKSVQSHRPLRRGSWLSEVRSAQRKYSLGGLSLASTTNNSQPPTPSLENGHPLEATSSQGHGVTSSLSLWESTPARPPSATATPWGVSPPSTTQTTSFWAKKDPPRWNEFSGSPSMPSSAAEEMRSPTNTTIAESYHYPSTSVSIPFDIPLVPNRKTVRSQSYSAGQLDMSTSESAPLNRFKTKRIHPPSLARRTSRTIMDSGSEFDLASVQEDPELQTGFIGGATHGADRIRMTARQASTLSLDNAEMAANSSESSSDHPVKIQGSRRRPASSSQLPNASFVSGRSGSLNDQLPMTSQEYLNQRSSHGLNIHASDGYQPAAENPVWTRAPAENIDMTGLSQQSAYSDEVQAFARPMQYPFQYQQAMGQTSSQGMQGHSFIAQPQHSHQSYAPGSRLPPTRNQYSYNQNSVAPAFASASDNLPENVVTQAIQNAATEAQAVLAQGELASHGSGTVQYNQTGGPGNHPEMSREGTTYGIYSRSAASSVLRSPRDNGEQWSAEAIKHGQSMRLPSELDVIYHGGGPFSIEYSNVDHAKAGFSSGEAELRNLYLVTFKASRAEVFARPSGFTGDLSEGQMVIVEGDRGLDMGMVAHCELNREQAKALKAEHNRKHYNTLVRFSRNYPHLATTIVDDPDYEERASQNLADQALGPLGAPGSRNANLNPRSIRRIATEREIMLLREKEGNEARAKRICQGKVNQQHLSMEILDAEFQLDYRKLTFYFYSEEYIPFNAIVTDLFKVWKTRIWLSAVNPETYPAPPRRPGDQSRQPRRNQHDNRKDQSLQAATAARRAYIRGAQDLAMGHFPGSLAATFATNSPGSPYQPGSSHQAMNSLQADFQGGGFNQGPFSPGRVVLPQAPFGNHQTSDQSQNLNALTFGSLPPMSPQSQNGNTDYNSAQLANGSSFGQGQGQLYYNAIQHQRPWTGSPHMSSVLSGSASSVAETFASRGELPPAFVPSGQQQHQHPRMLAMNETRSAASMLPGLGDLSLTDTRDNQRMH